MFPRDDFSTRGAFVYDPEMERVPLDVQLRTCYPVTKRKSDVALCIGNGPEMECELGLAKSDADVWGCNGYACTEAAKWMPPDFYVLLDKRYWKASEFVREAALAERHCAALRGTAATVFKPVHPRAIYGPAVCRPIRGFPIAPVYTGPGAHLLYDAGLAVPPLWNAMAAMLFLAVRMGYDRIEMVGCPFDDIRTVHRVDGGVAVTPEYANGAAPVAPYAYPDMEAFGRTVWMRHRGFNAIRRYADARGCSIVNHTKDSLIDSFEAA